MQPDPGRDHSSRHLDRNPVAVNESFTSPSTRRAASDGEPDFSPLETCFDILNQSQSSRVQIVNGRMDSTKQWQLTLMARDAGRYTLPAIEFGKDRSNPLELEVQAMRPMPAPRPTARFSWKRNSPRNQPMCSHNWFTRYACYVR